MSNVQCGDEMMLEEDDYNAHVVVPRALQIDTSDDRLPSASSLLRVAANHDELSAKIFPLFGSSDVGR